MSKNHSRLAPKTAHLASATQRTEARIRRSGCAELDRQIRRQNGLLQRSGGRLWHARATRRLGSSRHWRPANKKRAPCASASTPGATQRKALPKHLPIKDLPEADRLSRLRADKKHFVDVVKLIAYRAETAMARLAREKLARLLDNARALLRQLYHSAVDLIADQAHKTLTVRLHHLTTPAHDQILAHLCAELNATETVFPGTDLRLIYQLGGSS